MNVYDSEKMAGLLRQEGFSFADKLEEASLVLINTCCVRQHAEDRVFSLLGRLEKLKKRNPRLRIIVAGCMAQFHGKELVRRFPGINLVLGTQRIFDLPGLIEKIETNPAEKVVATAQLGNQSSDPLGARSHQLPITDYLPTGDLPKGDRLPITNHQLPSFVAIMRGCNRFCSYCVVPYVRGKQWSKPAEEIIAEIEDLVARGIREVTLLGQNVNAYNQRAEGRGQKAENPSPHPLPKGERKKVRGERQGAEDRGDFADLLKKIDKIEGLEKFSFIASHPKDVSDKLIKTLPTLTKFSREIHLPAQSGSDRILKLMKRGYTREEYLRLLNKIRQSIPDVRIGSDFIVGFPSEIEEDFQQTLSLIKEAKFSFAYMFKYSPRPGTMAAYLKDDVPGEIKKRRLAKLLSLQKNISRKNDETRMTNNE